MINRNRKLMIEQLDRKIAKLGILRQVEVPQKGWINAVRTALNMSLVQLARKLDKQPATIKEIEEREQSKSITLKKLIEVGNALDLQFVYGFLPKDTSIEKMIEKRAKEVAREIVLRTSQTMKLENQENRQERLEQAIKDRTDILKQEIPKHLWD
jgi:predicted DNA-binding mobile mystery protein A